jgi:hypothetical protein
MRLEATGRQPQVSRCPSLTQRTAACLADPGRSLDLLNTTLLGTIVTPRVCSAQTWDSEGGRRGSESHPGPTGSRRRRERTLSHSERTSSAPLVPSELASLSQILR